MKKFSTSVPGIYTITCIETDKVYVGQSENCTRRWAGHKRDLISGKHRNYPLRRAWNAYGPAAFVFEIVAYWEAGGPSLDDLEREVLGRYSNTYNLMEAGSISMVASEETRAKLGKKAKERWADPAYKARLSEAHAKRNADPEYRAKHREAMIAFNSTPEGKAIRSKVANDTWAKEGARERRGTKTKAHWADPAHREQQIASRKATWNDPEVRKRRTDAIKAAWDAKTPQQQAEIIQRRADGQARAKAKRAEEAMSKLPQKRWSL